MRVDKFRGYENEDINRWFEKLELQLATKNIRTTDQAAISQVVNNLGRPAETFLFELPEDERRDYDHLKQSLKRRYSTKDRTWMKRQLLVSQRQESNEMLADYNNGMHELFSGLNCSWPEKVTYSILQRDYNHPSESRCKSGCLKLYSKLKNWLVLLT